MSAYEMPSQQPGPQQGQYGHQETKQGKGMAVTALVLGVLALLLCWTVIGGVLLGLPALILGLVASSRAKKGRSGGRGLAIGGWVTGLLGIVLGILIAVLAGTLVAQLLNSEAADKLERCLSDAGSNQQQAQQCQDQFERDVEDSFGG